MTIFLPYQTWRRMYQPKPEAAGPGHAQEPSQVLTSSYNLSQVAASFWKGEVASPQVLKKSKFQSLLTILLSGLTSTLRHFELPQGQDLATPGVGSPQLYYFILPSNVRCPDQPHVLSQTFSKWVAFELLSLSQNPFLQNILDSHGWEGLLDPAVVDPHFQIYC